MAGSARFAGGFNGGRPRLVVARRRAVARASWPPTVARGGEGGALASARVARRRLCGILLLGDARRGGCTRAQGERDRSEALAAGVAACGWAVMEGRQSGGRVVARRGGAVRARERRRAGQRGRRGHGERACWHCSGEAQRRAARVVAGHARGLSERLGARCGARGARARVAARRAGRRARARARRSGRSGGQAARAGGMEGRRGARTRPARWSGRSARGRGPGTAALGAGDGSGQARRGRKEGKEGREGRKERKGKRVKGKRKRK